MTLVIYHSNYGHTQSYADWIAGAIGAEAIPLREVSDRQIVSHDTIIFGSPVIAGNYKGLDKLFKWMTAYPDKHFIFYSVSILDPKVQDNQEFFLDQITKNIGQRNLKRLKIFYLRGGLDVSMIKFSHRAMIKMMVKILEKKETLSESDQVMVNSYYQAVDFTNRDNILPIINSLKLAEKKENLSE